MNAMRLFREPNYEKMWGSEIAMAYQNGKLSKETTAELLRLRGWSINMIEAVVGEFENEINTT